MSIEKTDSEKLNELIGRVNSLQQDQSTKNIREDVSDLKVMANDIKYIKAEIAEIKEQLAKKYVTREEYVPVRNLMYGFVGLILLSFIGAVVSLVIKTHV